VSVTDAPPWERRKGEKIFEEGERKGERPKRHISFLLLLLILRGGIGKGEKRGGGEGGGGVKM